MTATFFCPDLTAKNLFLAAGFYSPLLTTTGPVNVSNNLGSVRGSYVYNPSVSKPAATSPIWLFQKKSDLNARKVFGLDFIDSNSWLPNGDIDFNSPDFAHSRSKGWNGMFSDGSVEFKRATPTIRVAYLLSGFNNGQYDIKGICDPSSRVLE